MIFIDSLWAALPQIAAAVVIGVSGIIFHKAKNFHIQHEELLELKDEFREFRDKFSEQHKALMNSQRNQIKNTIVHIHDTSSARGYIKPWELDCVTRLSESYTALGGNSYIHVTMEHINALPIRSGNKKKSFFGKLKNIFSRN